MNIKESIRNLKSEIHNPRKYAVCEPKNNVEKIVSMAILVSLATASCGINNVKTQDVDFIPAESTTYITEPTESTSVSTSTTKTTTEFTTMLTTTTDVSTEISNASDSTTATEQETVSKTVEVKLEEPTYSDPIIETEPVVVQPVEEYLVYKPSTHYAHKNTCRWNSGDAYRCDNFSELEVRICSECNPEVGEHIEYVEPEPETPSSDGMTYFGYFSRVTYYPATAYYSGVCGGSGRTLIGYGNYDNGIRGSIASRSLYETYGYNYNGRTTVYLEFPGYESMNGYYYVDDCCASYGVIDVFVWDSYSCPFYSAGVITANCYIN